ncbi:MAG: valyl-tRNA synthase, partial [Candidatus Nealsonbacteria bacterium CG23_combo_of_CG06-09_8_20_14_all_39_25]
MELSKAYEPQKVEGRIYTLWEKSGFLNPDKLPGKRKKTYTIVIPPPNITGFLHMGHALNATCQDILIRWRRMQGYKTLWLPGTDHAGIATQNVVEKELKKEGKTRFDLGREEFIKRVWQWKEKYGDIILDQLKKMGCSCDWSRTRFTMDKDYVRAVEAAFQHYYDKGWIYKGKRVVNW